MSIRPELPSWRERLSELSHAASTALVGMSDAHVVCNHPLPTSGYAAQRLAQSASSNAGTVHGSGAKRQANPAQASRKAWRIAAATVGRLAPSTAGANGGVLAPDTSVARGTYYKPYRASRYSLRTQTSRTLAPVNAPRVTVYNRDSVDKLTAQAGEAITVTPYRVIVTADLSVKATCGINTSLGYAPQGKTTARKAQGATSHASDTFFQGL